MIQSGGRFRGNLIGRWGGGGQREREKKKKISSGAEEPLAFRKEEHQKSSFLPSFLFLRLEKHKTHAHTCTKWIGDLIQWFLATRLIRFSFFFFLLLLFLFRDGWSSRHLCSVSYFAGNFISNNLKIFVVVVVGLVCLSVAQLLISSRRTYTPSKVAYIYCFVELLFSLSCAVSYGYGWGEKMFLWYWPTINQ